MRIRKVSLNDIIFNRKLEIYTKEEIIELLNTYKNILNTTMIDYLDSLIELKLPVTKDAISSDDRKVLSELEIYKKVVTYNIYNIIHNLTKEYEDKNKLNFDMDSSSFYIEYDDVLVFSYSPINKAHNYNIMDLYQTIHDEKIIDEELDRVMSKFDYLRREGNPFSCYNTDPIGYPVVGGPADSWEGNHQGQIAFYENLLQELQNKKELTSIKEKEIEITSKLHKDLIEVFNLDLNDFKEQEDISFYNSKSKLNKKMVKCMPQLNIIDNIKYV